MRLKELIDALTSLQTVCGPDTETEADAVGLKVRTRIDYEKEYGYSHRAPNQKRTTEYKIALMLNLPDCSAGNPEVKGG